MKVVALLAFALALFVAANAIEVEDNMLDVNERNATVGCTPVSCATMRGIVKNHFPAAHHNNMLCIAYYESSYCPGVYNGICCYGLYQIHRLHLGEPGCPSSVNQLYDANVNARCARHVLDTQGLKAWEVWTQGKCRSWSKCLV